MGLADIAGVMVGAYLIALGLGIKGMLPDNLRGNKLMLAFGALCIAINFAISYGEHKMAQHKVTPQEIVDSVKGRLNLPVQMDEMLRLETVLAGKDRVNYNFSVAAPTLEDFQKKIAGQRDYMQKNGCTLKDSIILLSSGIIVQMNYSAPSKLGGQEEQIILTPKDCGFMTPEEAAQQAAQKPAGK